MRNLIVTAFISFLSLSAVASEWCPQHEGKFPAAVVDAEGYKIYFFVPGQINDENDQNAVVYVTQDQKVIDISAANGHSDYYTSIEYIGPKVGFSCDSASLDLEWAWYVNKNGERLDFGYGEVRAPGYQNRNLVCIP